MTAVGAFKVTEHFFEVPRDWRSPSLGSIRLFARSAKKHTVPVLPTKPKEEELQWLCFFQGGPGNECGPPQGTPYGRFFIDKGYHVLSLDQRGTGLSSPVSSSTLAKLGDEAEQAKFMKCFRQDSIVCDAEAIRLALTASSDEASSKEGRPWSVIGQSFGGWCITTFLSMFPDSLTECFTFGGTPPVHQTNPDEIYRNTAARTIARNHDYYGKFPDDIARIKTICRALSGPNGRKLGALPDGGQLSARRFLNMGLKFGFSGGLDQVHEVVLRIHNELELYGHLTWGTLELAARQTNYDMNPIYAILHEQIYCQKEAPNWSAKRALQHLPEFDLEKSLASTDEPVFFFGEMIFPFMFEDYAHLKQLVGVAQLLAEDSDWPMLYDLDQLRKNKVPVYSVVYKTDMCVAFSEAEKTLDTIKGVKPLMTNVIYHDGIRTRTEEVVGGLWKLRCDTLD